MSNRLSMYSPLALFVMLLFCAVPSLAQLEEDAEADASSGTGSSVIGVHRTWHPDLSYRPNTGLFLESIGPLRRKHFTTGAVIIATGVGDRNVIAGLGGVRAYLLGTQSFGLFASLHGGISIGSRTGLAGFDIISDPTLTFGLVTLSRFGATLPVAKGTSITLAAIHTLFTNERGAQPVGLQIGLTLGGDP